MISILDDLLLPHHQIKIDKQDIGFNIEKSILCVLETSQIVCHTQGGRGYCLGRCQFSSGNIYQWKFKILRDSRCNEGTCLGIALGNIRDFNHSTSKDMWLYKSSNGSLYHGGEVFDALNTLPEYSAEDIITVQLDLQEGTLSFAKNNAPLILAFDNLPSSVVELYPVVVFHTSNHGERVQLFDLIKMPKDQILLSGRQNFIYFPILSQNIYV